MPSFPPFMSYTPGEEAAARPVLSSSDAVLAHLMAPLPDPEVGPARKRIFERIRDERDRFHMEEET